MVPVLILVVLENVKVQTLFLNDILCSSKLMASQPAELNAGGLGQRKIDKLVIASPLNILLFSRGHQCSASYGLRAVVLIQRGLLSGLLRDNSSHTQ